MKKPHTLNITVDWAEYVRLYKRLKGRGISFSKWVREQIEKELKS